MEPTKESLSKHFVCPKCKGRGAFVQEVALGRSVARMIPLSANDYLAASCTLCGYTEFYLQLKPEKVTEEAKQGASKLAREPDQA